MTSRSPPPPTTLVLRSYLPLPEPYVAPRSTTERELEQIWRSALTMDQIGVEDTYRDLGGDSLAAAAIFAVIETDFGVCLPTASLLTAPTIAALAQLIDEQPIRSPDPHK